MIQELIPQIEALRDKAEADLAVSQEAQKDAWKVWSGHQDRSKKLEEKLKWLQASLDNLVNADNWDDGD